VKLWRATTVKCEHLLSCTLKLVLFVSPISCCDAACFAILTFSEPLMHTLVMKVSRGRLICHGTCAMYLVPLLVEVQFIEIWQC